MEASEAQAEAWSELSSTASASCRSPEGRQRKGRCNDSGRLSIFLLPRPPNVHLLRALWSALDGIWGLLKGSWGVLVPTNLSIYLSIYSHIYLSVSIYLCICLSMFLPAGIHMYISPSPGTYLTPLQLGTGA